MEFVRYNFCGRHFFPEYRSGCTDFQNDTRFFPIIKNHLADKPLDFQEELVRLLGDGKIFFVKDKKPVIAAINNFIEKYLIPEYERAVAEPDSIDPSEFQRILGVRVRKHDDHKKMHHSQEMPSAADVKTAIIERFKDVRKCIAEVDADCFSVRKSYDDASDESAIWHAKTISRYSDGFYSREDITLMYAHVTDFVVIDGEQIKLIPNNEFREFDGRLSS